MKYSDGLSQYNGSWNYNKIDGQGVMIDRLGNKYEGSFLNNMRHGEGTCVFAQDGSKFNGIWANNVPYKGTLSLMDGTLLDGDWNDEVYSGCGVIRYANGDIYQGEWRQNTPHRYGKKQYKNGRIYSGEWNLGLRNGNGVMEYPNGDVFEGTWKRDNRDGYGVLRY